MQKNQIENETKIGIFQNQSAHLSITNLDSRLNDEEKALRHILMKRLIDNQCPISWKDTKENKDIIDKMSCIDIQKAIKGLCDKNVVEMDEEELIKFIYPVSGVSTPHQVTLSDDSKFHAMCAIDAMGTAFTFKKDVTIESKCSSCGDDIKVEIKNGKLINYEPETLHVIHVDLEENDNWSGTC